MVTVMKGLRTPLGDGGGGLGRAGEERGESDGEEDGRVI